MLIIRKLQMETLQKVALTGFEKKMVVHLSHFFPEKYEVMAESGTRHIIRYGIERARHYGIVAERNVCKYIDVMAVLGPDFDMDANLPWATDILTNEAITDKKARLDMLLTSAMAYIEKQEEKHVG